jgi:hypothetical protein
MKMAKLVQGDIRNEVAKVERLTGRRKIQTKIRSRQRVNSTLAEINERSSAKSGSRSIDDHNRTF